MSRSDPNFLHIPVLLEKSIDFLNIHSDGIYVDCTAGGGGHSAEILKRLTTGRLICFELDRNIVAKAKNRLSAISDNYMFFEKSYIELKEVLEKEGIIGKIDGILFDLGISSFQTEAGYGMSFNIDEPLDMRFSSVSSRDLPRFLNSAGQQEIEQVLQEYGEERNFRKISAAIVKRRANEPILTTFQLKQAVFSAFSKREPYGRVKQAVRRVFQALRIYANDELANVESGIKQALEVLKPGGRLAVISYHSLEDRIVKRIFRENALNKGLKVITKKPIIPNGKEQKQNRRSRSAKLRIIEK